MATAGTPAWRPAAVLMAVAVLMGTAAAACGATSGTTRTGQPAPTPVATSPEAAARLFLDRYVDADGRVVRHDQGGDTVSEGQAYALLLDVAVDDRSQFATVWAWSQAELLQPDGLLAYHWVGGRVADDHSASDADLDVARALLLAAREWHDAQWQTQGVAYARAIVADETVVVAGTTWLVAGPWARHAPYELDPSYYDPATFAMLAAATGDPVWGRIETSSTAALVADTGGGTRLPSDWAQLDGDGRVTPAGPPAGGTATYGYDAFRVLVRQDDCDGSPGVALDGRLAGLADRTASPTDRADTYTPSGAGAEAGDNPLVFVAAAGASEASGDPAARTAYLASAASAAAAAPSYYLDAWVAMADYLLTTTRLTECAA